LLVGGSGSILVMAGLERYEVILQIFRAIFINLLAFLLVSEYHLKAIVVLFVLFSFLTEIYRVIVIYYKLNIHPFSSSLIWLLLFSVPFLYFGMNHGLDFTLFHFLLIPVILYLLFILIFFKQVKSISREALDQK